MQTDATFPFRDVQHCCIQHVKHVWPPCKMILIQHFHSTLFTIVEFNTFNTFVRLVKWYWFNISVQHRSTPLNPTCYTRLAYRCEKFWLCRQRTYVRPHRLSGRGRGVPRQPDGGWRMPSFLGGAFAKRGFLKSLACLAKRFSSTEMRRNIKYLYMKRKNQKITQLSFGGRRKVQVTKFAFEDFIFVVGSAANSVGAKLEFAAFGSSPDARYSGACAFCFFFLSTTMVFAAVRTHFPRKNTSMFTSTGILPQEKK